jgi:rod shape determining protein RodA
MTFIAGIELRYIGFLGLSAVLTILFTFLPIWEKYVLHTNVLFLQLFTDFTYSKFTLILMILVFALAFAGYRTFKKRYYYWIAYFTLSVAISVLLAAVAQKVLKEYQIMRLIVFLDPSIDPKGSGWNILQSMTAIGSGGFFGKGFLQGTQSHLHFLPEQSTDFIFSIIAEEIGFFGCLIVFSLFLTILYRGIFIIKNVRDEFGVLITTGVCTMIIFHYMINVGMAMGIMPITGIPLFFLSYGGSSLLAAVSGIGLILSVYIRRFRY